MDGVASSVTARLAAPSSFLDGAAPRAPRGPLRGPNAPLWARGARIVARLRVATQMCFQSTALLVALIWGLTGSPGGAQDTSYPIFTADQLDATMKTLGPNIAGVRAAIRELDYATAKERGIRSREQLATTVTFWRDQERDDAVAMLRAVTDRLDALDGLLSTPEVDAARVGAALVRIQDGCAACHRVYREQDSVTGAYRLRQSAVRGL